MGNNVSMTKKLPRNLWIYAVVFVLAVVLTVIIGYQTGVLYSDYSVVATVNGEPIYVREFKLKLKSTSTKVLHYFEDTHGAKNSSNFWSNNFDGEVPNEVARQRVLDELIRIKIQEVLAKEKGIIKSTDYREFIKDLDKENRLRKEAAKKNELIYGPEFFGEVEYFNYVFDNMVVKLKESLKNKELAVSEEKLMQIYDSTVKNKFKRPDNIKVQKIVVSFVDDKGIVNEARGKVARNQIEDALDKIQNGESFETVALQYSDDGKVSEQLFLAENSTKDREKDPKLFETASLLKAGEVSEVLDSSSSYIIIKCVEREDTGFIPFEDAKKILENELVEKNYSEYITGMVEDSNIKINRKIYDRMVVK